MIVMFRSVHHASPENHLRSQSAGGHCNSEAVTFMRVERFFAVKLKRYQMSVGEPQIGIRDMIGSVRGIDSAAYPLCPLALLVVFLFYNGLNFFRPAFGSADFVGAEIVEAIERAVGNNGQHTYPCNHTQCRAPEGQHIFVFIGKDNSRSRSHGKGTQTYKPGICEGKTVERSER